MTRLEVGVSCRKLKKTDHLSKSDPVCILYEKVHDGSWTEVGRTEMVKNCQDPSWQKKFQLDYNPNAQQCYRFDVYDWDSKSNDLKKHDYLGRIECTLAQIVSAPNMQFVSVINEGPSKGGQFVINAEQVLNLGGGANRITIQFGAKGLDNKDFMGKSDPFFVLSKMSPGGQLGKVAQSEVIKNNLNPIWKPMALQVSDLCSGDFARPLKFEVFDSDGKGQHDLIGSFSTTLTELLAAPGISKSFYCVNTKKQGKKGYKHSGEVNVMSCKME